MVSTSSSFSRRQLLDFAVMALCLLGVFLAFEIRDFVYFRDYSITFEGAYRLFLGQIPYRDFGTPVGPVSFLIPALFFKILEPNWTVFMLAQQFQNVCLLLLLYLLLGRVKTRTPVKHISLITFSVFYLLLLSHPWYNITGTLVLLAAALCALVSSRISILAAGILSGLSILAKQDFGLLTILISGFFVTVMSLGSDGEKILVYRNILQDKGKILTAALNLLFFLIAAITIIALCIHFTDEEQFKYWFNYGQKPHEARSITFSQLLVGIPGWIAVLIALRQNNFRLLATSIFLIAGSVTQATSGLRFTHYYGAAFLPVIVDELLRLKIRFRTAFRITLLCICILMMARPLADVFHVFESMLKKQPEHFFFNYRKLSRSTNSFPKEFQAFSPHTQAPQQTIDAILELKRLAAEKRLAKPGSELKVLNISELTPIYTELGATPPKGLPLWFHTNISLFPRQIEELNATLAGKDFDIILLQGTHEGLTPPYRRFLSILNANPAYSLLREIQDSPANATSQCDSDCEANIFIYVKNP